MRFSTRSRVIVSAVTIVAILCAFILSGLFFRGNATYAASSSADVSPSHITKGVISPFETIDPTKVPTAQGQQSSQSLHKGTRSVYAKGGATHGPATASMPFDEGQPGQLLQNFNGVSSRDSAVTNFGAEFEPPDQGLCEGNGFILEPVNSAYTFYRTDGSVVAGPFNVNVLFGEGLKQFTSDPRCYYDKTTNRWFAIILYINFNNPSARTDISVSSSGDPTKPWTVYHLNATDDGTNGMPSDPGCPCLGDQHLFGIDSQNFYIITNEFSILGTHYNG